MSDHLNLNAIEARWKIVRVSTTDEEAIQQAVDFATDLKALLAALRAHRKALQELNVESDFRNPRIDAVLATVRDEDWQSA